MKIVTTQKELEELCRNLQKGDYVTVDTEFIRERTFWAKLCLIQVANPKTEAIIDPLADGLNLSPFFKILEDKKITKVFHAAKQDIEIFWGMTKSIPKPLFDTQIAAMVCGYGDQVGYYQLVEKVVGEKIDKSSQFSDWARRPLTDKQLTYALSDVTHLREVYGALTQQLKENNRAQWLTEEIEELTNPETYEIRPQDAWKRTKSKIKKPEDLEVLKKLAEWREIVAQKKDRPRRHIVRDEVLQDLAQQKPESIGDLKRLRAIPKGLLDPKRAKLVLEAVKAGKAQYKKMPKVKEKNPKPKKNQAALAEMLKLLLKIVAHQNGVAPKLIANVEEIDKIIEGEQTPALNGWRKQIFGIHALRLMKGEILIGYKNNKIEIVERR